MATRVSATVTVNGTEYRITRAADGDSVSIDRREGGMWVWSGDGRWTPGATGTRGGIYDCAADLGENVYAALEEALTDAIAEQS